MENKKFYLNPVDNRKSFYNKCYVILVDNIATLYSYDTKIMTYDTTTGEVTKTKDYNYSMTTKRHQNAFKEYYNIND